jgi:hypothetical protein
MGGRKPPIHPKNPPTTYLLEEVNMELRGLHILLTYQCTYECDHCFVWGSPFQSGVSSFERLHHALRQAQELGTVTWIYFEGGEPFLYYPTLVKVVAKAANMGFNVGIVSNAYWAVTSEDAQEWLRPFAGLLQDLAVSSDLYHYDVTLSQQAQNAAMAAEALDIPLGVISVASPEDSNAQTASGTLPHGESGVMYRGRAAKCLVDRAGRQPWHAFTQCPHEDLRDPGRLHLDPFGNLHICQGISLGNLFEEPLTKIIANYDPEYHPITSPLLFGGPAELARRYEIETDPTYADACHLCDQTRRRLREKFPEILKPDQMYGVPI